jgi:hypothetical protein
LFRRPFGRAKAGEDWPVLLGYGGTATIRGGVGAVATTRFSEWGDYSRPPRTSPSVEFVQRDSLITPDPEVVWIFPRGRLTLAAVRVDSQLLTRGAN